MRKAQIVLLGHGALNLNYLQRKLEESECVGIFISQESLSSDIQKVIRVARDHFHFKALSFHDSSNVLVMRNEDFKTIEHIVTSIGFNKIEPVELMMIKNTRVDMQSEAELLESFKLSLLFDNETKNSKKMKVNKNSHLMNKLEKESKVRAKRKLHQRKVIRETWY